MRSPFFVGGPHTFFATRKSLLQPTGDSKPAGISEGAALFDHLLPGRRALNVPQAIVARPPKPLKVILDHFRRTAYSGHPYLIPLLLSAWRSAVSAPSRKMPLMVGLSPRTTTLEIGRNPAAAHEADPFHLLRAAATEFVVHAYGAPLCCGPCSTAGVPEILAHSGLRPRGRLTSLVRHRGVLMCRVVRWVGRGGRSAPLSVEKTCMCAWRHLTPLRPVNATVNRSQQTCIMKSTKRLLIAACGVVAFSFVLIWSATTASREAPEDLPRALHFRSAPPWKMTPRSDHGTR